MPRATRQNDPSLHRLPAIPNEACFSSKVYQKKDHSAQDKSSRPLSKLQRKFPEENLEQISPEWQLDWCRIRAKVEAECLLTAPPYQPYNGLKSKDWTELRSSVIQAIRSFNHDDSHTKIENIAGQASRYFVYAPVMTQFCHDHQLITKGPWVPFVKKALGLKEDITWEHCMGIYVLASPPGADPLLWHTDFNPMEEDDQSRKASPYVRRREDYLHKLVNVLVPMQDLTREMGFTVTLDRNKGRVPVEVRKQGQWYALDPGYPHAANGNSKEADQDRLMLNISYVHPDFPEERRRHVISHLAFWKVHLPDLWQEILKAKKTQKNGKGKGAVVGGKENQKPSSTKDNQLQQNNRSKKQKKETLANGKQQSTKRVKR